MAEDWAAKRDTNRANWQDRVAPHVAPGSQYSKEIAAVTAGDSALQATETEELAGRLDGKKCLHLCCHIGTDTISLKHAGASSITGVDFSSNALAEAAKLATAAGLSDDEHRWVECDVYNAAEALGGEQFDVVFVSVGTLCWLNSIERFAKVVGDCLAPGGMFYIKDSHPMLMTLADDETDGFMARPRDEKGGRDLLMAYPYFETAPLNLYSEGTYADRDAKIENTMTYEWNHPLGAIVTSLIGQGGLQLAFLHEHRVLDWQFLDTMVQDEDPGSLGFGGYRLPEHQAEKCALMFSLMATKPKL